MLGSKKELSHWVCYGGLMVTQAIPVDTELAEQLDALAKKMWRPVEEVAGEALREYLDYTRRFIADVEAGLRDADAGRLHTLDEVRAELLRRRALRGR
jgi:predicted transcriptional regulator